MISVFTDHFKGEKSFLKDAIQSAATKSLKMRTSQLLFMDDKEERIKDASGLDFVVHYYRPRGYFGPIPDPYPPKHDWLVPPYDNHVGAIHLGNGAAHYLTIHRNQVKFGHTVLASDNPSAKQGDLLNEADFYAMSMVLEDFGAHGIAFYNSGDASGTCPLHKNVQYVPYSDHPLLTAMSEKADLPFCYYHVPLRWFSQPEIKSAYHELMEMCMKGKYGEVMNGYNFILGKKCGIFVPRAQARHPWGVSFTSIGVSGHLFIYETSDPRIKQHPLKALTEVCYPAEK